MVLLADPRQDGLPHLLPACPRPLRHRGEIQQAPYPLRQTRPVQGDVALGAQVRDVAQDHQ